MARREMPHVQCLVGSIRQAVVDSADIVQAMQLVESADTRELPIVEVRVLYPTTALCGRLALVDDDVLWQD